MFNDDEIEILDFDDEDNIDKKINVDEIISDEILENNVPEDINILNGQSQQIRDNNTDLKPMSRTKIIIAKPRLKFNKNTSKKNKTQSNSGYIIIIAVIIIASLIMLKMIINVENKHQNNTKDTKNTEINKVEDNNNVNELKTICKLNDNTVDSNVQIEKTINFISIDHKIKKTIVSEKTVYLSQDTSYINKISSCSTDINQYNSHSGYNASCNIDDHNNTIITTIEYDLEKINLEAIQYLKPPVLLDSNIQDVINNYTNINYICK